MAMVGLVLLIACANVANLLLARGSARQKELAVRLALGAGRGRLVRQLLLESLLLSLAGGALGLLVSAWLGRGLIAALPLDDGAAILSADPDLRVALFAALLSVLTGIVFGLVPAFQSSRVALAATLKNEAGAVVGGTRPFRFRRGLVVAQIALSLLLLVGAGLFTRSLMNLRALDPGFRPDGLITFRVDPSLGGHAPDARRALHDRLRAELLREPGVRSVSMAAVALMDGSDTSSTVLVQGYQAKEDENMNPGLNMVGPDFFTTLGIPLLRGREILDSDRMGAPKVAVVNESFARYFFGDQDPLGRRFGFARTKVADDIEIVGVVRDGKSASLREQPMRFAYVPAAQQEHPGEMAYYVSTAGDPGALASRIAPLVRGVDTGLPVTQLRTMRAQIRASLFSERIVAGLSAAFGLLATLLAALGLYGVMAYAVARRTREIGIRMALGADRGRRRAHGPPGRGGAGRAGRRGGPARRLRPGPRGRVAALRPQRPGPPHVRGGDVGPAPRGPGGRLPAGAPRHTCRPDDGPPVGLRKGDLMDAFVLDLRQALRSLAGRPGFSAVAVLTVALGVGANAAIFTLVNAALLRSLPFPDADRLAVVWAQKTEGGILTVSWPEYEDWRAQSRSFEALGAWRGQSVNLTGTGEPDRLVGSFVSGSFFEVLRARPQLGRFFRADESDPGKAAPVAVLSHLTWERRFGRDPAILGRVLVLNGQPHTVIGVAAPELGPGRAVLDAYFLATEVWLPAAYFPNKGGFERGQDEFIVVGRLAPSVSREAAQADLGAVARRLEETYPDTQRGRGVRLVSLQDQVVGDLRPPLLALMGAVALVLLIACANVANLLLARAVQRQREMAVRAALGAGRWRLVRQLLTESLVIAGIGGVVGAVVASAAVPGLLALIPDGVLPADIGVDGRVLAFTALVTLATALVFGVLPGLQASRPDLETVLRETGRGTAGGRARRRVRDGLVVAEVALSLVLLVGAGLLLRTVHAMGTADPGFRPERVLTAEFRLPPARYDRPERIAAFFRAALEKLQAVPGVESAALIRAVPFSQNSGGSPYLVEGRDDPAGKEPTTQVNIASPGYFETIGIPVLAGRAFDGRDRADTPPAAVVNATFARQAWGDADPVGRRFRYKAEPRWLTVVGVVGDIRHGGFTEPATPQAYTTHEQDPKIFACVVVRTAGDPLSVAGDVRKAIWAVDPDQPVWRVRSLGSLVEGARGPTRSIGILLTAFAALAVFLAAVGLYGVLSGIVAQRTREIGIRMALGAPAIRVIGLVVGRGMALTGVAIVAGLAGAAALSRVLGTLLFGVRPLDPVTFGGAAAVLAAVALGACCLPAWRAARLDPVTALAEE